MRGVNEVVREWCSHVVRLIEVIHVQHIVVIREEVVEKTL